MNKRRKLLCLLMLILIVLLCGCEAKEAETNHKQEELADANEDEIVEIEKKNPIFVDTTYDAVDEKRVYFDTELESVDFSIVDQKTREVVFSDKTKNNIGNFSKLTTEGTYFVEAKYVGRSQIFTIEKDYYQKQKALTEQQLLEYLQQPIKDAEYDFEDKAEALHWLLMDAYFHGGVKEGEEINEEFLAECQKIAAELIDYKKQEEEPFSCISTTYYGCVMLQMYECMLTQDEKLAEGYLKEAKLVREELLSKSEQPDYEQAYGFYLDALLYRGTKEASYHQRIKDYFKETNNKITSIQQVEGQRLLARSAHTLGVVAYLSTESVVESSICADFMETFNKNVSGIARYYGNTKFDRSRDKGGNAVLLQQMYVLSFVEHIVVSQEYINVLENCIHYLSGANIDGTLFLTDEKVRQLKEDENGDAALTGMYVYILGEIIESEEIK